MLKDDTMKKVLVRCVLTLAGIVETVVDVVVVVVDVVNVVMVV